MPRDSTQLDLTLVSPVLRGQALQCWEERDIVGVLCSMDNMKGLPFVFDNQILLQERGVFEKALLHAYIACRVNSSRLLTNDVLNYLFDIANQERLLLAGDPLPGNGPFTLYRGVAGKGTARRIRGLSWTADFERAKWFALRYESLPDPAVFKAIVPIENVYAYTNERQEQEFLCDIPKDMKLERISLGKG